MIRLLELITFIGFMLCMGSIYVILEPPPKGKFQDRLVSVR